MSDTAITTSAEPMAPESSFGEAAHIDEGRRRFVYEGAAKVARFGEGIVGIAGYVDPALAFITWMRPFAGTREFSDAVERAAHHLQVNLGPEFELIFARRTASEIEMLLFSSRTCRAHSVSDGAAIGSAAADPAMRELLAEVVNMARGVSRHPDDQIVLVIALLQSLGLHNAMLADGYGGAYYGASVGAEGIEWSAEMLHVIHLSPAVDEAAEVKRAVGVCVTDGFVVLRTSANTDAGLFLAPPGTPDDEALRWASRNVEAFEALYRQPRYLIMNALPEVNLAVQIIDIKHTPVGEAVRATDEGIVVMPGVLRRVVREHSRGNRFVFVSDRALL